MGARATINVALPSDPEERVFVRKASSDNPDILEVVGIDGDTITVLAHQPGDTRIEVVTNAGVDWSQFTVEAVGRVRISDPSQGFAAGDENSRRFLAGGRHVFDVTAFSRRGDKLLGEMALEDKVDIDAGVADLHQVQQYLEVTFGGEGELSFSLFGTEIVGELVSIDAIEKLDVDSFFAEAPVVIGDRAVYTVSLRGEGDTYIGGALSAVELSTQTPEVCEIRSGHTFGVVGFALVGLAKGQCVANARIGDHREKIEVEVVDGPEGHGEP